ncbi:MAG: hypothetical protein ABIP49_11055 [Lysobacterales bacterium]
MRSTPSQVPMRSALPRRVEPEWLDELPADDPRAVRSRRDLKRVNRWMGSMSILLRELDRVVLEHAGDAAAAAPPHLVELGAGDGSLMLRIARQRKAQWPGMRLTLLDREPVVDAATLAEFRKLGWQVDVAAVDVFDWLAQPHDERRNIVCTNLFVHHFAGQQLEQLLQGIALMTGTQAFVCLEPRRSRFALGGSHLLGAIGCNAVTRHDAVLSVHAGFRDGELGALWPSASQHGSEWNVRESAAGIFSHLFAATRA